MQQLTKQAIKKIQQKTNHQISVDDFDDISSLDRLADKVCGVSSTDRRLLRSPIDLCGIKFYPLTIAKSEFYKEKIKDWGIDESVMDSFFFWILTLPLNVESLDNVSDIKTAKSGIKNFLKSMHCTPDELADVCRKCCGGSDKSDEDGESSNESKFGGLVAVLIREYGQSADHWLYETPIERLSELYCQFLARMVAEESASQGKAAKGGKAVAPRVNASIRSLCDFRKKCAEIEEKWST